MNFRNCPCDCTEKHTCAMNITDHHTQYVHVTPLKPAKSADEVLTGFERYCYTYGFPKKILTDNGKEFANKTMEAFCKKKMAFKWLMVLHELQPLKVWLKDQIDLGKRICEH